MPERRAAVDRALALAERRFGVGRAAKSQGWLRDRVQSVLEEQAARHGLALSAAVDRLERDHGAVEELVTALRVGETRFYRDKTHWEALARHILPAIPRDVEIAALSAGCSTGEEAYTLAMLLGVMGRRHRVVGVDRSSAAVAAARAGAYAAEAARDLPPGWIPRFCEVEGERLLMRPALRASVTFEECDLVQRTPKGPFHVVFFKNVLLYLAAPAGETVAMKLARELAEGGALFAASSEVPRLRQAGLTARRIAKGVTVFGPGRA